MSDWLSTAAPSPICHGTASLAIENEVLGNAFSNANISKPSSPSSSVNNDCTSDKEVSSDKEEHLFTQPNAVDLSVDEEEEEHLFNQ